MFFVGSVLRWIILDMKVNLLCQNRVAVEMMVLFHGDKLIQVFYFGLFGNRDS
jgi:hypothetical protein